MTKQSMRMEKLAFRIIIILFVFIILANPHRCKAGPPYDTDDPEPVDLKHWEFYCASHNANVYSTWAGTAPHFEINYGAAHNLQLHVIIPLSYYYQPGMKTNYGQGDIEFGAKFRLMNEDSTSLRPQIGIFPLVELPTGNADKGLGNGNAQVYLPVWLQKSFGKWQTYAGGGFWFNNGPGNKNFGFVGWQAQYQVAKKISFGGELYYITASQYNTMQMTPDAIIPTYTRNELRCNIGTVIDVTDNHHILFSVGRSLTGGTALQGYVSYQLTI